MQTRSRLAVDLFSAGRMWQAVMNVCPPEQLWEFFYIVHGVYTSPAFFNVFLRILMTNG